MLRVPRHRLPVSHATHLVPFVELGRELGAPVEKMLEREHLPAKLAEESGCYVPTKAAWGFIERMGHQEGVEDLGFVVGYDGGLRMMGPTLAGQICRAATLAQALRRFCRFIRLESSEMKCWLTVEQEEARFHLHKTFGPEARGFAQTEWLGLTAMLTALQLFAPPRWAPSAISRRSPKPAPELAANLFGNAHFLTGNRDIFIAFPKSMLSHRRHHHRGNPRFEQPGAAPVAYASEEPEEGFGGRLTQCLEPHLADGYPHLALAAELADTSVRTLQRRLGELGISYSEVVDRARFDVASRLLTDTDATSVEIAHAVAYTDPSHFARAFRRLTGVSPLEYRAQHRE